jgi:bifunctional oligoribonuclease and PAP phosphatase NrnA
MSDPYQPILVTLARCRRVLVTTHVRPDGDALGSCAAMVLGLRKKGVESEVLLLSHLPRKYAFIFREQAITHHDAESAWPPALDLARFDCLLVLDTGTWSQLPGLRERIEGWSVPKLVVDHHLTQEDWPTHKLVITQAAAAGEIVAELLELWNVQLDSPIATALYLAITSDTGWFQFSNTRPYTLRLAAMLMEAGVDTDRMYQLLYQNERAERVALQARAMHSLQLLSDNRLAVMTIRREDFTATKANVPDTENLINVPLQIATVEVALLFTEPLDDGPVRVSLRSKGQVNVADFAATFGGGGHARASGLKLDGPIDAVQSRVIAAMLDTLKARGA